MPHINRIRVNNVKYNFGTQVYDDFMMRFSCKNTIYDLANGGGKSVLMLLLLQNLIPNCTLDEKQPIEKLFRTSSGSNTIHSLIEWKLDPCYRRDNFKYMVTGFCARKGKDSGEELKETANIEYFNYCIFYREFGDNDIKNLPLSKDGERITYNGLKSYLRDLERKDHGVEVHIFERKGDYQNFISGYGLFESEWEIVRGINKTEGHVRTYFENNYKTGRKVVEDLLIEEIIQKSFNNQIGNNAEEDGMAKTLLDIKDRIIELSKRKEEMNIFDKQIELMKELSDRILSFKDFQGEKEKLKNELVEKLAIARKVEKTLDAQILEIEKTIAAKDEEYKNEDKLVSIAKLIDDEKELVKLKNLVAEFNTKMDDLVKQEEELNVKINYAVANNSYREMKKYESLKEEVLLALDNRMRDNGDVYEEIYSLCAGAGEKLSKILEELNEKINSARVSENMLLAELERIREGKEEAEIKAAVTSGSIQSVVSNIEEKENALNDIIKENGLLLAEQAAEEVEKKKSKARELEQQLLEIKAKNDSVDESFVKTREKMYEVQSEIRILNKEIERFGKELARNGRNDEKIKSLKAIYGDEKVIYKMYKNALKDSADLEVKIQAMNEYIGNLSEGRYMLDGRQYREVEEYLFNNYGEDVMYGYQWYGTLLPTQQRDIAKRIPFLDYSFVILGDFERIKQDVNLRNFSHSSYIVPIISEGILRDTRHAASADYIVFGTKDLSFLMDPAKVEAELDSVRTELYAKEDELKSLKLKQTTLWEDYLYMLSVSEGDSKNATESMENAQSRKAELEEELSKLAQEEAELRMQAESVKSKMAGIELDIDNNKNAIINLSRSIELHNDVTKLYEQKKILEEELVKVKNLGEEYRFSIRKAREAWEDKKNELSLLLEEEKKYNLIWKETFEPYYRKESSVKGREMEFEQLLTRFKGLVNSIDRENSDVTDKKTLIKAYEDNIEKCLAEMSKYGYKPEDFINAVVDNNQKNYEERVRAIRSELNDLRRENDSQNALMNRMEGSLSHARGAIAEKYGEFQLFECDNTTQFIYQHKELMKSIKEQLAVQASDSKKIAATRNEVIIIARDIERMLKNSSVNIPEDIACPDDVTFDDLKGYEVIQKDFDRLTRNEFKKKEEFAKDKRKIANSLKENDAFELAEEVEFNVEIPETVLEIVELTNNIKETCECILLEKERVAKGIEDMERIKESFESRCIQTCANIKAELDRLPKLSKITLDNEVISMIGLSIPYVKEEFYRERMSAYINDTATFAESFKTEEERIAYIKGRLSWKKLFSVIVTDMNGIRLNLYKRERIKDQSRYLRYEEAVGSTGQSQGIYIQFLIAIINYISNINAAGKEASSIGKVIFIDNPFGAAKDIYIWEPIFKLLKTNHVQLIVPARGATPAITGRFDVNYILGQKMVNGRQQTVVVDYRSQVQNDAMEYTRLDYTQESLF